MSKETRRPASPSPQRRQRKPRLKTQLAFGFGILLLALGAFYTALVVATQIDQIFFPDSQLHIGNGLVSKLPGIDSGEKGEGEAGPGGRINILVMGIDRRPNELAENSRTDTMFVMTIDPASHTARGLGIPRDMLVNIPSKTGKTTYQDRVNTVYEVGEMQKYDGGGAALAKGVVGKTLGLKINYYVVIDFQGFKKVIDLLGGIDVDVPPPGLNDPYYSETELRGDYFPCIFKPGRHHMNASEALCYSRSRNFSPGGDLDRILRQQLVMYAVMEKATDLKVLADPSNVLNLYKRYKDAITTDINEFQLVGMAKLAAGVDRNQLAFLSIGPATTPHITPQGAAVLLPSEAGIKTIVEALLSDNKLQQEAAVVQVQAQTPDQGTRATEFLQSLGIAQTALSASGFTDLVPSQTQIIDFGNKPYTAERIAGWLSVPKERVRKPTATDRRPGNSDIVVLLGPDAKLESALTTPAPNGAAAPGTAPQPTNNTTGR
jgi:LCP family protein required for cell wall assembly